MVIKLVSLKIENFKGLKKFELKIDGKNAVITGANGTGKTTLADAFYWCLSGSDSLLRSKFNALSLDEHGNTIDNQDAVVEVCLSVDGTLLKLQREYRQKWTKKRGHTKAEFSGNTTNFFADDVPLSKLKYESRIAEIIDPKLLRSLSDVRYFVEQTKPEFRRNVLLDLAGNVDIDDLISDELREFMGGRSVDDSMAILRAEQKKINQQLDQLPGRIDEITKMMPTVDGEGIASLREQLTVVTAKIDGKNNEVMAVKSGLKTTELKKDLAELDAHIACLRIDSDVDHSSDLMRLEREIAGMSDATSQLDQDVANSTRRKKNLIADWKLESSKAFAFDKKCYACGQDIPSDQISEQKKKFDYEKEIRLKKINDEGKKINDELHEISEKLADYQEKTDKAKQMIEHHKTALADLEVQFEAKRKPLLENKIALENRIYDAESGSQPDIDAIEQSMVPLEKEKVEIYSKLIDFDNVEKFNARIRERKQQLKDFAIAYEDAQHLIEQIEDFSIKKSGLIEENVSSFFKATRWNLFENYQSGGIREICEPTRGGVPYSSDLNTGSRINVGLDIIAALSKHYGVTLPVFVDNSESVTEWIDIDSQVIKLVAMANVKEMEVGE